MRVLVACEFSGIVRDAFSAKGHDAFSCDLLPTERPGNHFQGDIREILYSQFWDLMIAHPPCTRLANSGVHWLNRRNLWEEMRQGAEFFKMLLNAPIGRIGVENPIPHRYALEIIGRKYDQIIQPWQFGHPESKATCLWLKGLPNLKPTNILQKPESGKWENQTPSGRNNIPPSPNRWKERSRTYEGIALAMADQWN
jgi:hypothetical protein